MVKKKITEFCYYCDCRDYHTGYYLHVDDGVAYCRGSRYDHIVLREGDEVSYKHACQFLAEDKCLKVLMLKRKFDLLDVVVFCRGDGRK